MVVKGESMGLRSTIVGSVMAHALVVAVVPAAPANPRPRVEPVSVAEFELAPLPAAPDPVVPPSPRHAPSPPNPRVVTPAPQAVPATPSTPEPTVAVEPNEPALPAEPAAVEPPPAPERSVAVIGGLRIDPRAAALSTQPVGPAPSTAVADPSVPSVAERDRALASAIARDLAGAANARPHVSHRGPPVLHRRSDGSYVYTGTGFAARIEPDGSIAFSDRSTAGFDGFGNSQREGVSFHFDLNDGMHRRHGNDPYQAERSWFMRETEDLRTRLADAAVGERATRAARSVRGRLLRIWDDETRTTEQRRLAMFRIWDDCAEDETGEAIRGAVVGFVRERLPRGTEGAYTDVELARLNAGRESQSPFQPY